PSQEELIEGAVRSVQEILLPELQTPWARATALQLHALLRYTLSRQADDLQARQDTELRAIIAGLRHDFPDLVPSAPGDSTDELRAPAGDLLVYAQDHGDAAAAAIRARLRPVALRHCAEDL